MAGLELAKESAGMLLRPIELRRDVPINFLLEKEDLLICIYFGFVDCQFTIRGNKLLFFSSLVKFSAFILTKGIRGLCLGLLEGSRKIFTFNNLNLLS